MHQSWPWWRRSLTVLSVVGLALSGYLGWHHVVGGTVIGCGGGSPCDQVLNSRWSSVGGVLPVSGLAAGAYLAMLAASLFMGSKTEAPVRLMAWSAMLVLAGSAAGSAVWFIIVQKWIIGSFCPYCMAAHITSLLMAALVVWQAPRQCGANSTESSSSKIPPDLNPARAEVGGVAALGLALAGVGLAGIMAICQAAISPPPVYRDGEARDNLPPIDFSNAPLVGSSGASHMVNLLFDYKCRHCQQLHFMLNEAVRRSNGHLAFVLCPTPLNTQCNPFIPHDVNEFKNSCELAKLALAVWVAKREVFADFERWMFSLDSGDLWRPRSVESAKAKAVELVGQSKFDAALADPWINQYLEACIRIYGTTTQNGNTAVPKMVYGSRWVIPQPSDSDELISILRDSLALPIP